MSIEAMVWALKEAPDVPAPLLGVLMAIAERADEHGCGSYYSVKTLAGYSRKSKRQVGYDIDALLDAKLIRLGDQSLAAHLPVNRRPVVYDCAMELKQSEVQPIAPQDSGVQSGSPHVGVQPIAPQPDGLQSAAPQTGTEQGELPGVQPIAPQGNKGSGVQPIADNPKNTSLSTSVKERPGHPDPNADREDIRRICAHLADRVEQNGFTRPGLTKTALDAARLMLDRDGRTEDQVHRAIEWASQDHFWYKNVRSVAKLREHYETLREQAKPKNGRGNGNGHAKVSPRAEHRTRR